MFDRVQHDVLIELIRKEIPQQQDTLDLLRKLLKVGYVDIHNLTDRERYKKEDTPQGSIISPLLANIYLHELDVYIEDILIPEYMRGEKRLGDKAKQYRLNHLTKEEKNNPLLKEYPELKKIIPKIKRNQAIKNGDANYYQVGEYYARLYYVRYADDTLLGLVGTKDDAKDIVNKINRFLNERLKLELNLEKCAINLG